MQSDIAHIAWTYRRPWSVDQSKAFSLLTFAMAPAGWEWLLGLFSF